MYICHINIHKYFRVHTGVDFSVSSKVILRGLPLPAVQKHQGEFPNVTSLRAL